MIITIVMINIANDNTNYELFLPITTDMKYHYIYISLLFGNMIAIDQSFIS